MRIAPVLFLSLLPRMSAAAVNEPGFLQERWTGIEGRNVADFTDDASFDGPPDSTAILSDLDTGADTGDYFGERISGYLRPTVSGDYRFCVAGDDQAVLYLSSDEQPANAVVVASLPPLGYSNPGDCDAYPEQRSQAVRLEAGAPYYIMVLHKENFGGDNLSAKWSGPGISESVITDSHVTVTNDQDEAPEAETPEEDDEEPLTPPSAPTTRPATPAPVDEDSAGKRVDGNVLTCAAWHPDPSCIVLLLAAVGRVCRKRADGRLSTPGRHRD
ncbi:MAG: PA14 domain-containing protein [Myxococcota bacterium]|nr:PA14 domain-containing protein [Myxococcota bacterium]